MANAFHLFGVLKSSGAVPTAVCRRALLEALRLLRSTADHGRFRDPDSGEGAVSTERKVVCVGALAGILCTIEADFGNQSARFTCVINDPGADVIDLDDPVSCANVFFPDEPLEEIRRRLAAVQATALRRGRRPAGQRAPN